METVFHKKSIVFIDDNLLMWDVYGKKIITANFQITFARNGKEGYKKITTLKPDLIITDLVMPKEDGYYVIEKVRANKETASTKIIAFSDLNNEEDVSEAKRLGANDVFSKSQLTPEMLVDEIKNMI